MALLRHDMPDGSWHFDWLLEPPAHAKDRGGVAADPNARVLISFRVSERVDEPGCTAFVAERIGAHRLTYLDFEGPIGDDGMRRGSADAGPPGSRGCVTRVASGRVWQLDELRTEQGPTGPAAAHAALEIRIIAGFADAAGRCLASEWLGRAIARGSAANRQEPWRFELVATAPVSTL